MQETFGVGLQWRRRRHKHCTAGCAASHLAVLASRSPTVQQSTALQLSDAWDGIQLARTNASPPESST